MIVFLWVGRVISLCAGLYMLVMLTRMVLDWIRFFSPLWRPTGLVLPLANAVYALTDPPLKMLRRIVPPLRLGEGMALDLAFMILFLVMVVLQRVGIFVQGFAF